MRKPDAAGDLATGPATKPGPATEPGAATDPAAGRGTDPGSDGEQPARRDPRDAAPPHLGLTSTWSIRSKLIAVLAVPLVALLLLWGVATWVTLGPGLALLDAQTSVDSVGRPTQTLIAALQAERKLAVGYLAALGADEPGSDTPARPAGPLAQQFAEQTEQTDAAVAEFRANADSDAARSALTPVGERRLDDLLLHLSALPALRDAVEQGSIEPSEALRRYTRVVEGGLSLARALIRPSSEDLLREAQALMALSEARELLAREDAVLTGAVEAGRFASTELSQAVQLIGARRYQAERALSDLHPTDRTAYTELIASEPAATLHALEDRLIGQARPGEPVPIDGQAWRQAYDQFTEDLRAFELEAADRLIERSRPEALFIFGRIAVAGLIGLIAVVVTALGSLRIARSVLRRLAGLRQAALELAIDRIPRVVTRLRAGERVDVAAEAPPLPYGADEIGQVGHAFNALQRQAVGAAVAEADLRRGVNDVFLNIARRSQTLLHRQLSILDAMERRTEDPVELEDLFRVDHLATRMRRHAEDLVILAGASPGRGWRMPVPLVDVLRGAISEVEDYARVTVRPVPDVAIAGRAVGDIIHLLAELIENATAFSPPSTKVTVGAEPVTHGIAVEIEDRGIGIDAETLNQLNTRLAEPPDFSELASRSIDQGAQAGAQLGLFVVARLAARHGVKVQLRRSAYGGTTAVVMLPNSLLTQPGEQPALPGRPGESTPPTRSSAEPTTGSLVPVAAASPTAPRSAAVGFTPVPAQGDPLPSRRSRASESSRGSGSGAGEVIVATTGRPLGRHARQDVIEPVDDDSLPRRVRRRDPAAGTPASALPASREGDDSHQTLPKPEGETTTRGGDARSPEQIRAMMSSFQAGLARGREAAEEVSPDTAAGVDSAPPAGGGEPDPATAAAPSAGLDGGEQSGAQASGASEGGRAGRRRRAGGGKGEATEGT